MYIYIYIYKRYILKLISIFCEVNTNRDFTPQTGFEPAQPNSSAQKTNAQSTALSTL